jgi:hypothetical protein
MSILDIELTKFKNSVKGLAKYKTGIRDLIESGFINFLRIWSRPFTPDKGANVYTSAYTAAFCEGYNKCLDDLVYFEEQYLSPDIPKRDIKPNFGALSIALAKGDLTVEDIRARHGTTK